MACIVGLRHFGQISSTSRSNDRASSFHVETTCSESPFTQSIPVALAAVGKSDNPRGDNLFNGLIGVPKTVNVFDCHVEGVRHQLNVCRFEHRIADEWNY
jgi:hypothetical protein